jgi:hypothetical protein
VDHASGTVANPMTDGALAAKFHDNAEPSLGAERARALEDEIWSLDTLDDLARLVRLAG